MFRSFRRRHGVLFISALMFLAFQAAIAPNASGALTHGDKIALTQAVNGDEFDDEAIRSIVEAHQDDLNYLLEIVEFAVASNPDRAGQIVEAIANAAPDLPAGDIASAGFKAAKTAGNPEAVIVAIRNSLIAARPDESGPIADAENAVLDEIRVQQEITQSIQELKAIADSYRKDYTK